MATWQSLWHSCRWACCKALAGTFIIGQNQTQCWVIPAGPQTTIITATCWDICSVRVLHSHALLILLPLTKRKGGSEQNRLTGKLAPDKGLKDNLGKTNTAWWMTYGSMSNKRDHKKKKKKKRVGEILTKSQINKNKYINVKFTFWHSVFDI